MALVDPRQPSVSLLTSGGTLYPLESAHIDYNNHLSANRFQATFPLDEALGDIQSDLPMTVELWATLGAGWASIFSGTVDTIQIDPIQKSISLDGRDLTSRLLASQTRETFENQTSSQIVSTVALRNGLTSNAMTTSTPVGRYFGNGRTRTALYQHARATSDWDLLVWLAQIEGYDLWVDHLTLNFQPPSVATPQLQVTPADCLKFSMHRRLDIAAGVSVQVSSWNCQMQQSVAKTVNSAQAARPGMALQVVRPNLSSQDALVMAQRLVKQMAAHEREINYSVPADMNTFPRMKLQLADSGMGFDGIYDICEVERQFSAFHGFVQHVRARSWISS